MALAEIMLEKDIVAAILRYLKGRPHCFAWKTHGGMYGTAGIPELQEVTLKKIEDAGGVALKVTSVEEVKAAILEGGFL